MSLPLGPERAETARLVIDRTLDRWGRGDVADRAALCASELVSELAVGGVSDLELRVRDEGETIQVELSRFGPERDFRDLVTEGDTGRAASLCVVDEVASLWGVVPMASGETVWFEV